MSKKILITGAAGFLGSHLAKKLLDAGHAVVGVDNLITGKKSNIEKLNGFDNFHFITANVIEEHILGNELLSEIDEVFHLASPASPKFYQIKPWETIYVNTVGTHHMLELAKRNNANLVFTSTSEAYGDPEIHPQPEDYFGNVNTWGPRACYDESKRMGEVFCYEYSQRHGVNVKVARLFNTYSAGLRNDDGRVISNFVTQAITGNDITVYGDGSQTRSFCYVDDTVEALILLMEKDEANGEIVNIGNPIEYSILQLANLVKKLANSQSKITFHPMPVDDPKVRRPVIDKATALLGWEPKTSLEKGLSLMITVYRSQLALQTELKRVVSFG